jgi:chloramphenicol O-acetyltransferase
MTNLVISLGSGKGTWNNIINLINAEDWESITLIGNSFFIEKFERFKTRINKKINMIKLDCENKRYYELVKQLISEFSKLPEFSFGTEVALNITSGTGKEHAAIISSLLKSGLGVRLVDFEDNQTKEI